MPTDPTTPTWRLVPEPERASLVTRLKGAINIASEPRYSRALRLANHREAMELIEALAAAPAPQELPPVQLPEPAFRAVNAAEGLSDRAIWLIVPSTHSTYGLRQHDCYTADQLRAAIAADRLACAKARGE